jgi:hypothetical protein
MVKEKIRGTPAGLGTTPRAFSLAMAGVAVAFLCVFLWPKSDSQVRTSWANFPWLEFFIPFLGIFLALYATSVKTPLDPKLKATQNRNAILVFFAFLLIIFTMIAISIARGQTVSQSVSAGISGIFLAQVIGFVFGLIIRILPKRQRTHR